MSLNLTVISTQPMPRPQVEWLPISQRPLIGKDVLELLSSSMYVNPLSIYREYIQNAADTIDEARQTGLLSANDPGHVNITVDSDKRGVRITDNGTGLDSRSFVERLVAFGASRKRGSRARGFRGVGRLAGLGYCQELIFRSRSNGETDVRELCWDCRKLKAALRNQHHKDHLEDLVNQVVAVRTLPGMGLSPHFFEVEMLGIVRHGNDLLIDSSVIENYLSQVAPVPFAPEFGPGREIAALMDGDSILSGIEIRVNAGSRPIYKPHRSEFEARKGVSDRFGEIQTVSVRGAGDELAAKGWVLHHGYLGAFPPNSPIRGLRLRCGNMQVGEADLLEDLFPESRFNSWVVGEIHILDQRILPNGRRDHFEQNVHFRNVLSELAPLARDLVRRCRSSSVRRNWLRQFEQGVAYIRERNKVLRQAAITKAQRGRFQQETEQRLLKMEKIASHPTLEAESQLLCCRRLKQLRGSLAQVLAEKSQHRRLRTLRGPQKRLAQRLIDLIYEVSPSQTSARMIVEKILKRL